MDGAIAAFNRVLENDEFNEEALKRKANILRDLHRMDDAVEVFQKADREEPPEW